MREMKDSGVPWIGEIPKEWEVGKVHKYYRFQTGFTPASEKTDYYDDKGAEWITISDLTGKRIIPSETKKHISNLYLQEFKPVVCPTGSLLYSFKLSVGQTAFVDRDIYTNEAIACFFPNDSLRFLFYSSSLIENNAQINIYGAKLLNQKRIYDAPIVYPPLDEQLRIAGFLDAKCAEIDSVLEKTKASIEEYRKLKQSVITEAVTKGVRGKRPMKDSGVEWIGEIPAEWGILALKALCSMKAGKNLTTEQITDEGAYPVYGGNGLRGYYHYYLVDGDYLLIGRQGALCGNVHRVSGKIWPTEHAVITTPSEMAIIHYLYYLLISANLNQYSSDSAAQPGLSVGVIHDIRTPVPPLSEQQEIATYLDSKCAAIDALISSKEALVAELETYKKSLIYEYVTGKKEVPAV